MPATRITYRVHSNSTKPGWFISRGESTGDKFTATDIACFDSRSDAWQVRAVLCNEIQRTLDLVNKGPGATVAAGIVESTSIVGKKS